LIFFKKNKTVLKDLIPDNHIDIHSHLLPGIDDGAQTIEDTLFLIDSLKNMGIAKFITTPHIFSGFWDNNKDKIQKLEVKTISELKKNMFTVQFQSD